MRPVAAPHIEVRDVAKQWLTRDHPVPALAAVSLALETPVLLMDEPFGALDEQTRLLMGEWLLGIWARTRKTVVFVTHSLQEAILLSQRIVVMTARPGRIKASFDVTLPAPRDLDA